MGYYERTTDAYRIYKEEMEKIGQPVPKFDDLSRDMKKIWYMVNSFYRSMSINDATCLKSEVIKKLNNTLDVMNRDLNEGIPDAFDDFIYDMDN